MSHVIRGTNFWDTLWIGDFWSPRPNAPPPQSGKQKKNGLNTGPQWAGVRRVRSPPPQAPVVHFLLINYLRPIELIVFFILIHLMCSKIENKLKELTSSHTLSTKQFISKFSVFEHNYIYSFLFIFVLVRYACLWICNCSNFFVFFLYLNCCVFQLTFSNPLSYT